MPDQRVIKFRAWDKSKKRMGNVLRLSLLPDRIGNDSILGADILFEGSMAESVFTEEVVFMQFTGLTDVDRKEIYEGDIFNLLDFQGNVISGHNTVELADFLGGHYWIIHNGGEAIYKIIGNIWEDKEAKP